MCICTHRLSLSLSIGCAGQRALSIVLWCSLSLSIDWGGQFSLSVSTPVWLSLSFSISL